MRRAHTVEQVRAAEAALMARLPEGALMERAAAGLARAVLTLLRGADGDQPTYGRRVLLLVGGGDNGGDTLYAGARLAARGCAVEAVLLSDRAHEAGLAALRAAGGRVVRAGAAHAPDVLLDGIVGIGGRAGLRAEAHEELARHAQTPTVAVDTPSGVEVDTGTVDGDHVHADLTVTFGTLKACHLVDPAAQACGTVHLVDIGLGDDLPPAELEALQPADVAALLPRPDQDAQKYSRGVVGVRAGSATYPGAGLLSVAGAACGLAGMVRYVGDAAVADRAREAHPEVVGAGRVQAWVVGSGSGDGADGTLAEALADDVPLVVDADALVHLEAPAPAHAVLTPHAGELARLLDVEREQVEARPLEHVRAAVDHYRCTVLLKGRHTLVATPDRAVRVTTTGTPWLAAAGAGDVLGGLVGALLAAGLEPHDAASVGSWLHGAAATWASAGGPLTAPEVARAVPEVVRDLLRGTAARR